MQVTTRHVTGPLWAIPVLHCPYRKLAQQTCRLSHDEVEGQWQLHGLQLGLQKLSELEQVHRAWQSM